MVARGVIVLFSILIHQARADCKSDYMRIIQTEQYVNTCTFTRTVQPIVALADTQTLLSLEEIKKKRRKDQDCTGVV